MANPDRDTVYTTETNRTVYTRENTGTGWFIAIIVVLALLAIGYLVFSANSGPSTVTDSTTVNTPVTTEGTTPAPMTDTSTTTTTMAPATDTTTTPSTTAPADTTVTPSTTAPADTTTTPAPADTTTTTTPAPVAPAA